MASVTRVSDAKVSVERDRRVGRREVRVDTDREERRGGSNREGKGKDDQGGRRRTVSGCGDFLDHPFRFG